MATSTCSNISRQIVFKVGDELETFISAMNEVKHAVRVAYYVKWRYYGAKVIVVVRNQRTSSTIMYSLSKLRSLGGNTNVQSHFGGHNCGSTQICRKFGRFNSFLRQLVAMLHYIIENQS